MTYASIFEFRDIYSLGTGNRLVECSQDNEAMCRLTLNLTRSDVVTDGLGTPSINLATSAEGSSEDLLDTTLERLGERLVLHLAGDLDDLVKRDGLGVLDVLLLLAVTRRLLEGLDDER
jgi:hypothetical protein